MRNWPKTLPNASFRGVGFHVETEALDASGREVAVHNYVKAETHDTEDMGRKARKYKVDGYVTGDTADADALALVEACSIPGNGPLVLPLNGNLTVNCPSCTTSMHKDELGRIKLVMEFIESGNGSAFATIAIGDRLAASTMGAMADAVTSVIMDFAA